MGERKLKSHMFHTILKFKKSKPCVIISVIHNNKEDLKKNICLSIFDNQLIIRFTYILYKSLSQALIASMKT